MAVVRTWSPIINFVLVGGGATRFMATVSDAEGAGSVDVAVEKPFTQVILRLIVAGGVTAL